MEGKKEKRRFFWGAGGGASLRRERAKQRVPSPFCFLLFPRTNDPDTFGYNRSTRSSPRSPTTTETETCSRSACEEEYLVVMERGATEREKPRLCSPRPSKKNSGKKKLLSSDLHSSLGNLAQPQVREGAAVDVPVELLAALDDGLAPDAFTVQVFRRANRSNQLSKGKAAAVAALRDALLSEAAVKFPEAARAYHEVLSRETAAAEEKKN